MKGSFKLGNIAGIGVFVHWTFSLLLLFIVFTNYRAGHNTEQILWSVAFILSIFFTVFLHELGHALAAKRFDIATKDITLLPIGGLARLEKMPEKPMQEFVVAIAGPLVNIGLALITYFFITIPDMDQIQGFLSGGINANNFFFNFFIVNIWLSVFNLLPAFPMDGGRIFRSLLSLKFKRHTATLIAARVGQLIAVGFIILGFYSNPFLIFIGIFIIVGAQSESELTKSNYLLRGVRTGDVAMKNFETLQLTDKISLAVEKLLNGQSKLFLVLSGNQPVGSVSRDEIIKGVSKRDENCTVADVMNEKLLRFDAEQPLEQTYLEMIANRDALAMVYNKGVFVGVLEAENILETVMVKSAMSD